jgi:isopenicillin N synthase-like dioxygenase
MIPIIDVAALYTDDEKGWQKVVRAIDDACRDVGFFYIKGHQIPFAEIDRIFSIGQEFFALPEKEKLNIDITQSANHRGYGALAAEALADGLPGDLKETFDMGRNLGADDPEVLQGLPLHGPNKYPKLPGWQNEMEAHYGKMKDLGQLLLRAIAKALECPSDFFDPLMERTVSVLRLIHYPPAEAQQHPDQQGCGAHSDYGCITILAQDSAGGLQVQGRDGEWVDAVPIADTFVINIGDLMARWTNDRYVSTKHRVINPSGLERYSIPFFVEPNFDAEVSTLPSCITADAPKKYDTVTSGDWIMSRFAATYAYRSE